MPLLCLGSINLDHIYRVPRIPAPGETVGTLALTTGLGGKGANMSVAAARQGAQVTHLGAVGGDGSWAVAQLAAEGIGTAAIATVDAPTGHAIIAVAPDGENTILVHPGANRMQDAATITRALTAARAGDTLMLQNETDRQAETAAEARRRGLRVLYAAAPFDAAATAAVLPHATLLILNEIEARQLGRAGITPACPMVVTRGAEGAFWHEPGQTPFHVPAFPATPVDTTGAGDCFTGTLAAALDRGLPPVQAMRRAAAAAAIQITRPGAAPAMPTAAETEALL